MPIVSPVGYQFTLAEVRAKMRSLVMQESTNSRWTDLRLNGYINLALDDLRLEGLSEIASSSFTTTLGDQTWRPPADVWKILDIIYDDKNTYETTREYMDVLTGGDLDQSTSVPTYWYMDNDDDGPLIRFNCKFSESGKTVQFWYRKRAQDMTSDSEYATLYKVYVPVLVYRAVQLAKMSDGDWQDAGGWEKQYQVALEKARFHMLTRHSERAARVGDKVGWGG